MSKTPISPFTHFDQEGHAHMVDIGTKPSTHRIASASGYIKMQPETLKLIGSGMARKGDVLGIARIAGIMGAKKTSELIPLCHPLALTQVSLDFKMEPLEHLILCTSSAETVGPTGVEMEALMAVQIALLTIYDMCKAVDRGMKICDLQLLHKSGGLRGDFSNQP